MASEAKTKLRQETSQLTAENMVGATSGGVQSDRAADMCCWGGTNQFPLLSQELEEQLDQKDRLIKKLLNQMKSLEMSHKGKSFKVIFISRTPTHSNVHLIQLLIKSTDIYIHINVPRCIAASILSAMDMLLIVVY